MMSVPTDETAQAIEAAVFRRLVQHLDENKEVQNIDLMNLAGFCRNCLSKWYVAAAGERGVDVDYEAARERVYGMPYSEWKSRHPGRSQVPSNWRHSTSSARRARPSGAFRECYAFSEQSTEAAGNPTRATARP